MKDTSTPSRLFAALFVTLGLAIALVGCGGSSGGTATCDMTKIYATCAVVGCHSSANPAANFDMQTVGWETKLVGHMPAGGGTPPNDSKCANMNHMYLDAGSSPATGLFIDKLAKKPPECGLQMPNIPGTTLSAADLACVQTWANGLVAAGVK